MTVKELIEKLQQFDSEMEVGGVGHYGEKLAVEDVYMSTDRVGYQHTNWVIIAIEYAGPEPD